MRGSRALKGASLVAFALLLLAAGGAAVAGTDSTNPKPPKPSSLAPHPTAKRVFGAPIQKPIVHKRKKRTHAAAPAAGPAAPLK
jgi:hypothetical protein